METADGNKDRLARAMRESKKAKRALSAQMLTGQDSQEWRKERIDDLLRNIFPDTIARELLSTGKVKVKYYNDISVLFADIENFSVRSVAYSPVELVDKLDAYFSQFDDIVDVYCLEKIKTIGDCYMCAGGLPEQDSTNPYRVVMAGLVMQAVVARMSEAIESMGRVPFEFRLGIHTGEAVAGVVGKHKYAYDIFGKAANIASLMVQAGEIKRVNISRSTYELVSDVFQCVFRGSIPTKGGVSMRMYFVERLKPGFCEDDEGMVPNRRFRERAGLPLS